MHPTHPASALRAYTTALCIHFRCKDVAKLGKVCGRGQKKWGFFEGETKKSQEMAGMSGDCTPIPAEIG